MTLVSVTAYHSFGGEVEASNTPTIRRLTPSCRHQLPRIAHRRPLLLRLEHAHRPASENHVHCPPRLGNRRSFIVRVGIRESSKLGMERLSQQTRTGKIL